ncbi:diguanylate cyclase [Aureimonas sp. Leaf460]|nr:diguanylate cyclase [Aureimonas sp. Leaf427]KQT80547.1 diguanylate cyclase [Aureimonas sp. Leaf460]
MTHMNQGLCMFDAESRLVVCNRRYHEIFNLPHDRLVFGMTQQAVCEVLIEHGCYPPNVTFEDIRESTWQALKAQTAEPILRKLADGRILSVLYRSIEGGGWVSTFEDVTRQRLAEARIAHLSRHDALTDLTNVRTLHTEAGRLLAGVDGDEPALAVLSVDLDQFKTVNDLHGHVSGDELLLAVARRLRENTRKGDIISRLGGDEFVVIFRAHGESAALASARRLRNALAEPYDLSRVRLRISVSIGVSICTDDAPQIEKLLREADLALRHAKSSGRGAIHLFDASMSELVSQRHQLEMELHAAIVGDQLELHYQPLVDISTNRTVGVEALVRWRHPTRGLLPPMEFIGIAEDIGLIAPLGEWVLRRACADAAAWPAHISVAVNVASAQMSRPTFAETVIGILAETGLDPHRLEIELTETTLFVDTETTLGNLDALSALGIRFAIDDFGTGYSSLSYLGRFPIGKIKIDRSFIVAAETRGDALAIIRAVAGIGVSLGMTTLVEGVETQAQLNIARAEGLSQVQGYFFSRPVPKGEIVSFFHD